MSVSYCEKHNHHYDEDFNTECQKCEDESIEVEYKYKLLKKRLGINDAQVAEMFGYKNPMSFANSGKGKEKIIAGIVTLFEKISETQTDFWSFGDLDE